MLLWAFQWLAESRWTEFNVCMTQPSHVAVCVHSLCDVLCIDDVAVSPHSLASCLVYEHYFVGL